MMLFANKVLAAALAPRLGLSELMHLYSTCRVLRVKFYSYWGKQVLNLEARWEARFLQGKSRYDVCARPHVHMFSWMHAHPTFCRGGCGQYFTVRQVPVHLSRAHCCRRCFVARGTHVHRDDLRAHVMEMVQRLCLARGQTLTIRDLLTLPHVTTAVSTLPTDEYLALDFIWTHVCSLYAPLIVSLGNGAGANANN